MNIEQIEQILPLTGREDSYTEEDWKRLAKRAKIKWHPDKIHHKNPSPEVVKHHQEMFNLIDDAIIQLRRLLQGVDVEETYNATTEEANRFDLIKENAQMMRDDFLTKWNKIKSSKIKHTVKDVVICEGRKYTDVVDILSSSDESLYNRIIENGFYSSYVMNAHLKAIKGIVVWMFIVIISMFTLENQGDVGAIISLIIALSWYAYTLSVLASAVISSIPSMAAFMPIKYHEYIENKVYDYINEKDEKLKQEALESGEEKRNPWFGRVLYVGIYSFTIFPLTLLFNFLLKKIFPNKIVGRIEKKFDCYADLTETWIDDLLKKDLSEYEEIDYYAINHLFEEYKSVES